MTYSKMKAIIRQSFLTLFIIPFIFGIFTQEFAIYVSGNNCYSLCL